MAQLKDSLITGDLRVTGQIYGLVNIDASQVVSGTLPVTRGGTGATSFTANSLIMSGSGTTSALTTRAITNNTSNAATTTGTNIPTMSTIYYGQVTVNGSGQSRATNIHAPTGNAPGANAVVYATGTANTSTLSYKATANGALYATGTNSALTFGTLPVAQGGTGVATITSGELVLGNGTSAVTTKGIFSRSSAGDIGWDTAANRTKIPEVSAIAYWNGAYNSGGSSNLSKCSTGNIIGSNGGTMTGALTLSSGADLIFKASTTTANDPGDIVFQNSSGTEIGRIYKPSGSDHFLVRYSSSGTSYKVYTQKEITVGTGNPSGGSNLDIYIKYTT